MQASDCIDLSVRHDHCTMTFQIAGGTGRSKNASGSITPTETVVRVLADVSKQLRLFYRYGGLFGNYFWSRHGRVT